MNKRQKGRRRQQQREHFARMRARHARIEEILRTLTRMTKLEMIEIADEFRVTVSESGLKADVRRQLRDALEQKLEA